MQRFWRPFVAILLVIGVFAGMGGSTATAAVQFDATVTPDFFAGSGNVNGAFTVDRSNGVELGLRGKLRFDASCTPQNTFNSNGDGTYSFDPVDRVGCAGYADGDTPEWNFEWTVNTDYDASTGMKLNDLTYEIGLDADPGAGTNFYSFDPINVSVADHAIGDNTTSDGVNEHFAANQFDYANLISSYNVAQQSWNYEFFDDTAPLSDFDAEQPGIYDIYLTALDGGGEVASVTIQILVGETLSETFVTGGGWITSPEGAMSTATPSTVWDQDFSANTDGWFDADDGWQGDITASGGTAIVSGDGTSAPYSAFDGYRSVWPGTWMAEIDVYLDPSWTSGEGFDYSVAATGSDGDHQRDYIFHVGVVEDYGPIVGKALLVNGSNNTDFTTNPFKLVNDNGGNFYEVTAAGWYTLQHVFYDAGGYLAVDLNLLDAGGNVLWTATRSNAADTIPGEVGGNRYSWFTQVEVTGGIEVDNHQLVLTESPSPEGKANFSFSSKYTKNTDAPTGSVEFTFSAGDLDFHSISQDWLVVGANGIAQIKGEGSVDGESGYSYMLWAEDGKVSGGDDAFRIKIWNADSVVYDNGALQELGGGQITIHD